MGDPKISVVLSVFNDELYVREAINSLLTQTFGDFELLLFDDGSTDTTSMILDSFQDSRIILEHSPRNQGIAAQVNKGLERARGQYIARMDGDDVAHPERFARQVAFLDAHPEIGICGTYARKVRDHAPWEGWTFPVCHEHIQAALFFRGGFCNPSTMMRTCVLKSSGLHYDPDFPPAEDYHLWYRILRVTGGANLPEYLLDYRISESQMTRTHSAKRLEGLKRIRGLMLKDLGVDANNEILEFHGHVVSSSWPANLAFFKRAVEWLELLYRQNIVYKVFDTDAFGTELSEHLRIRCSIVTSRAVDGHRIYQSSMFARDFPLSAAETIRLKMKTLLKSPSVSER